MNNKFQNFRVGPSLEPHVHSAVEHDVLASNVDQQARPAYVLPCPQGRHFNFRHPSLLRYFIAILDGKTLRIFKNFDLEISIVFVYKMCRFT